MREQFENINFREDTMKWLAVCNAIVEEYMEQGLTLTLRQLYYQLVSRGVVPNEDRYYKKVSSVLNKGRMCGLIDWDGITDRMRKPQTPSEFKDVKELLDVAANAYRLPRWEGQSHYIELWVEKDALAGVLLPIANQYHITLMVNRGYSSQSAMYESSKRIYHEIMDMTRNAVILYLGDLDPSGEDMVRDINDRLVGFGIPSSDDVFKGGIVVEKIALTFEQVQEYNPPPNPTKMTDPRAKAFLQKYGEHSWEVDALPPNKLQELIIEHIHQYIDIEKYKSVIEQEQEDIREMKKKFKIPYKRKRTT